MRRKPVRSRPRPVAGGLPARAVANSAGRRRRDLGEERDTPHAPIAALQAAIAAEHIAIFGYGVLGAHLSGARQQEASVIWNSHRTRRDRLRAYIRQQGGVPAAAAPAYQLPFAVSSPRAAAQLAARLEDGIVAAYAGLTGADDARLRRYAALAMQEAVVRAVRWRGAPPVTAFPGLPDAALGPRPE
jgi:hypothetical protein